MLTTKTGRSFVLKPEVDDNEAAALRVLVPNKDGQYTGGTLVFCSFDSCTEC